MAIDLDSGDGLFDRLGALFYIIEITHDFIGGTSSGDMPYHVDAFVDLFNSATNGERLAIEGIQQALVSHQTSATNTVSTLQGIAEALLIEMVHADNPIPDLTAAEAIEELILQMESGSETVNASEPGGSVSYGGSNDGDGKVLFSVVDGAGLSLQRAIAEDIRFRFAGAESVEVLGQAATADVLDYNYPTGSGASTTISVIQLESSGVLTNSNFDSWTGSALDSWTVTGTVTKETGVVRTTDGNSVLIATSATPTLEQDISGLIAGQTPYVIAIAIRNDSGTPTTGSLKISITDGTSDIADEQSAAQNLTIAAASVSTTWTVFGTIIQLVDPLPETVKIKVDVTAAFDDDIYIDDLSFGVAATQLYDGGPYIAAIAGGTTDFSVDDTATLAITNTIGKFQDWFGRLFQDTPLLPSATGGGESIADSLIA